MIYVVWFIVGGEAQWIGRAASADSVGAIVAEYLNFPEFVGAEVRILREGGVA